MQLIVLGMHRSGTSVLARLLNLLGIYFGPEGISTGANDENPKGFWERRDVRTLNDAVLHACEWDWNRVAHFDFKQIPEPVVSTFKKHASRLILEIDAHRPWMLKEPRLCLLLPLWRELLEAPICIHVLRHPLEVASSLHKRNGIPIEAGLALWERYVLGALDASKDLPSTLISHRDLIERPSEMVTSLRKTLQALGVRGMRQPSTREVEAFVDPSLYRERETRADLQAYSRAPQIALFQALIQGGRRPAARKSMSKLLSSATTSLLEEYEETLPPLEKKKGFPSSASGAEEATLKSLLAKRDNEAVELRELHRKLREDVRNRDKRIAELERDRTSAIARIDGLNTDLKLASTRLAERDEWIIKLESQLKESRTEHETSRANAQRELNKVLSQGRSLEIRLEALTADLDLAGKQLAESQSLSRSLESELNALETSLSERNARVNALEHESIESRLHATSLEAELASVRAQLTLFKAARLACEQMLGERTHEIERLSEIIIKSHTR